MTEQLIQGSPEWIAARVGKVTASRVADIVAKTKTGYSAMRANYLAELLTERLTGQPAPKFTNAAMEWGSANEADARTAYEFERSVSVEQVGLIPHPSIAMAAASPDGLVGTDGLVEIKAPNTATHLETLLGGSVPAKYVTQMQFQMACTSRQWCDFCSYDPRLPIHMQLFVRRLERDDKHIAELESEIRKFLIELDDKIAALNSLYGQKAA